MQSAGVTPLFRSESTVETAVTELGSFNAMGIIGFQHGGARWQYLITKDKVGVVAIMDSRVRATIKIV